MDFIEPWEPRKGMRRDSVRKVLGKLAFHRKKCLRCADGRFCLAASKYLKQLDRHRAFVQGNV